MTQRALRILAGASARRQLAERGWDADAFTLLLGASGGPKWLVLSQLDRVLFGEFLARRRSPLHAYGTSIGSWRHACLAQKDPVAAIARLEKAYVEQTYSKKPCRREVTTVGRSVLGDALGEHGGRQLLAHPRLISHIGTARGRGPLASTVPPIHAAGLGLAMLSNALDRRWLAAWYQRIVFSSGSLAASGLDFRDFATESAPLEHSNVLDALIASGSIPLVLEGIKDPAAAPSGQYWDGGVIDYHHDLSAYRGEGLVLFPHFFAHIIPGWFDKKRPQRWPKADALDKVVLLTATESFVAQLPGSSIPDRRDFEKHGTEERLARWWRAVKQCEAMAEEFQDVLTASDPLARVEPFPEGA